MAWQLVVDNGFTERRYDFATTTAAMDAWALHTLVRKRQGYFSMSLFEIYRDGERRLHQHWEAT